MFQLFYGAVSSVALNFRANYDASVDKMFYNCSSKPVNKIVNLKPNNMDDMFQGYGATTLPEFENLNMSGL